MGRGRPRGNRSQRDIGRAVGRGLRGKNFSNNNSGNKLKPGTKVFKSTKDKIISIVVFYAVIFGILSLSGTDDILYLFLGIPFLAPVAIIMTISAILD